MSNEKGKKQRIQFDVTSEGLNALDDLKEFAQASSRAELIKNALFVYAELLRMRAEGYEILSRKGKEVENLRLLLPWL